MLDDDEAAAAAEGDEDPEPVLELPVAEEPAPPALRHRTGLGFLRLEPESMCDEMLSMRWSFRDISDIEDIS